MEVQTAAANESVIGTDVWHLDTPQLLIDLDVVDRNLRRMFDAFVDSPVSVRVHFKSLKCAGLARYIRDRGGRSFLCAKVNEAEVLADAGITDILIANQVIGEAKIRRVAELARRTELRVCVDDVENVLELGRVMRDAGVTLGVLVEVDIGMGRCGVDPGPDAVALAKLVDRTDGLRFDGLQGYDGHLQLLPDMAEKRRAALESLARLIDTRRRIEAGGLPVRIVTGAGTGTWDIVGRYPGVTEIQPGSFVLMDNAYHRVRPEFGCALSIMAQVISRRPNRYVLDAGSKAMSQDFGLPTLRGHPQEKVSKLAEEHTIVEADGTQVKLGERREIIPAHCCATMNLHRTCIAVRGGKVEAVWPIEASGRYD